MAGSDRLDRWMAQYGPHGGLAPLCIADVVNMLRTWAGGILEMLQHDRPVTQHSWILLLPDKPAHEAIGWLGIKYPSLAQQILQATEHGEECFAAFKAAPNADTEFDVMQAAGAMAARIEKVCKSLQLESRYRVLEAASQLSGQSQARDLLLLFADDETLTAEQFAFALWSDEETPADTIKTAIKRANAEFRKAGLGVSVHKRRSGCIELEWKDEP